ncbi:class I SAM-dependent methyltransferase [bacterium]|nr:class I SAM-dependent methyltransferase [bacterium]
MINRDYLLYFGEQGIELRQSSKRDHKGQRVDFTKIDRRVGAGNLSRKQPLPKAIGEHETVLDVTAGFGMDAAMLALMGYHVIAVEQSPIISAMVRDGLFRAEQDEKLRKDLGGRLQFREGDSIRLLPTLQNVEVVYLDPMFPPKRKKSALPPGHIQALQSIVGYDTPEDTMELFNMATQTATERVVVKRPTHAPKMSDRPVATHRGKLVRYEVYRTEDGVL